MPGVRGAAPRTAPSPSAARFDDLLRKLRRAGDVLPEEPVRSTATSPSKSSSKSSSQSPSLTGPSRFRQPRTPARTVPHAAAPSPARVARGGATAPAQHALAASIRRAAVHAGVHPALSVAVARAESSLNPTARSADGRSSGTFQVLPSTAAEMRRKIAAGTVARPPGTDDVALGVGYLRYLHDLFGRDATLGRGLHTVAVRDAGERQRFAVAAFNAGEGSVARAQARAAAAGDDPTRFDDVRRFLPAGTRGYVERVTAYAREEDFPTAIEV